MSERNKKSHLYGIFVSVGVMLLPFHAFAAATTDSFKLSVGGKTDNVEVAANQSFSVAVEALLDTGQTSTGYMGSILFTSSDTKATLPTETAFVAGDMGKKNFDLAFKLITTGPQTVTVVDTADNSITGELDVTVTGSSAGTTQGEKPVILIPADTSTINTSKVTISGTAAAGVEVTIMDGTTQLGKATADSTGNFTHTSDTLFDGAHTFTAQITSNGTTLTSDAVHVTIDSTSAAIHNVTLTPPATTPQGTVGIAVETEPNVSLVEAIVDQGVTPLTEKVGTPGTYQGVLTAPLTAGAYPVSIRVTDQSGNKQTYDNQATLTVTAENKAPVATITANPSGGIAPLSVSFTSVASDADGFVKSYAWDFGDGGTATQPNPTHVYATSGSYVVSLTVTDDTGKTGTARLVSNIIVTSPPQHTKDGPDTWIAVALFMCSAVIGYRLNMQKR